MENTYLVNSLDLTGVANAIRAKGETSDQLVFPDGFVAAIEGLKSGADLNFEVVGSTTKPTNPVENTIWVNTETEITGWAFSVKEPIDPVEGMVWFATSNFSNINFNAIKENSVFVYPVRTYQFISGSWSVPTDVRCYQYGVWKEFATVLYQYGAFPVEWISVAYGSGVTPPSVSYSDDHFRVTMTQGGVAGAFRTTKKVALAKGTSIKVTGTAYVGTISNRMLFCLWNDIGNSYTDHLVASYAVPASKVEKYDRQALISVDTGGEYYVGWMLFSTDGKYLDIYEIIAE